MARVFLSFLGTNPYTPCNYVFGSRRVDNVKYIQEALAALFCADFTDQDRVLIFLTSAAEEKNWLATDDGQGLEEALRKRLPDTRLIPKRIPEGVSETEIWQIFQIVYDGLEEGDEVIYDVTHGFRSLPILGMSLLNYARYLKNIKILGIYYGAFEALGPAGEVASLAMEKRDAPVFNLTSFDTLQQWSLAADNFTQFGITEKLSNLISRETGPALKETKGKHEQAQNEKKIAEALRRISGVFHTVRGKEIIEGSIFFETNNLLDKMDLDKLVAKPVGPIIGKIKTKLENFKKDDLDNGFRAVQWCIDHHLIQQGITLLPLSVNIEVT